jgi:hypothetical protein
METAHNSIAPRANSELFFELQKVKLLFNYLQAVSLYFSINYYSFVTIYKVFF